MDEWTNACKLLYTVMPQNLRQQLSFDFESLVGNKTITIALPYCVTAVCRELTNCV
jgi:hypothetical protein